MGDAYSFVTTRVISFFILAGLISGCGSQQLMSGQEQMRSSFQSGNYQQAAHIADSLKEHEIYEEKDRVLYALEKGTIQYFRGNHKKSIKSFANAEEYMDQFFTKSAKQGIKAFMTNDTQLNYNGEVYEDVYLNGFKSLSYLERNKLDAALVEARRIVQKLEQAESKYAGLAEKIGKTDTTKNENIEWKAGTSQIHDSPFGRYLSSVIYAKSGEQSSSRIELDKLKVAIDNHQALSDSRLKFHSDFEKIDNPNSYNTILTAFCGKAPDKVENNIEIDNMGDGTGLKIAIPKLEMRPSNVQYVEASVNDTMTARLPLVEEMDKVARETFKIKKPIIVARATVRGILKSAGQDAVADAAEEEGGEDLEQVVNFIGNQIREASERADLRGWQTMPGKVYSNVMKLPAGTHQLTFEYYSKDQQLLYSEQKTVKIKKRTQLEPVSAIYSD